MAGRAEARTPPRKAGAEAGQLSWVVALGLAARADGGGRGTHTMAPGSLRPPLPLLVLGLGLLCAASGEQAPGMREPGTPGRGSGASIGGLEDRAELGNRADGSRGLESGVFFRPPDSW
jgi:hypothetical protein